MTRRTGRAGPHAASRGQGRTCPREVASGREAASGRVRPRLAACGCALTTCGCALTAQGRVWPRFGRVRPSFIVIVNYECRLSPRDQADRARGASRGLARPRRGQGAAKARSRAASRSQRRPRTATRSQGRPHARPRRGFTRPGAASRGQAQPHAAKARPVIQAHPSHRYIIDTEEDWNPRLAGKSRITRVSGQVGRALF